MLFGILALLLGYAAASAPRAAAVTPKVTVTSLIKADVNGNTEEGPLRVEDVAKLSFNWAAVDGRPANGDSFRIALPAEFNFREAPLSVPLTAGSAEVGTCEISATEVVCTFNEKTDELQSQGFSQWSGSGEALLRATKETSSETVTFRINDEDVVVDLPGTGGIRSKASATYYKEPFVKVATPLNSGSNSLTWETRINTATVKTELAKEGREVTFDGSTVSTLEFIDELGPNQRFNPDLSRWVLTLRNYKGNDKMTAQTLVRGNGVDLSTAFGNYDMSVEISGEPATGQTAKIRVTGPFKPDANYRITYTSFPMTDDGIIAPGYRYQNTMKLDGMSAEGERYYSDSFTVTVNYLAGFGGFRIAKLSSGNGAGMIPAGTKYTVTGTYTLPGGATVDTYTASGWSAPGTPNADRTGGTFSYEVELGKNSTFQGQFPKGTEITLAEDPASASNAASGYTYGTPAFDKQTFTITDQAATAIQLTNPATRIEKGKFSVTKTVTGFNPPEHQEYVFTYTCDDAAASRGELRVSAGQTEESPELLKGTKCTITEQADSAQFPGFDVTVPEAQTVTIDGADTPVNASFTNTYTQQKGKFSIAKTVTGGPFADAEFTFTYTCDTGESGSLTVKGDGTAVESADLPKGSECTIAEDDASAQRSGYTLESKLSANTVTIPNKDVVAVTATNAYTQEMGSFSVAKSVAGGNFSGDTFEIAYTCDSGEKGTLDVKGDGTVVNGPKVPAGASCEFSESDATKARDGYSVATAIEPAKVTVAKDQVAAVKVTNTYTKLVGSFQIAKSVDGDAAKLAPGEYTFTYVCTDTKGAETVKDSVTVTAGSAAVSVSGVPVGTCVVTEVDATVGNTELSTALTADGIKGTDGSVKFAVSDKATVAVQATNTYTADRGTFEVAKSVAGDGDHTGKTFAFDYVCTSDLEGEVSGKVQAKGDGVAVAVGKEFPVGTTCEVTEDTASAHVEGYTVKASETQKVTIGKDETTKAAFVNTYTKVTPPPTPEPSPTPTPEPSPSATPTPEPSPSATPTPEPSPSATPTPTLKPSPSASAPVATPKPKPGLPKTGRDGEATSAVLGIGLVVSGLAAAALIRRRKSA